MPAAFPLAIKGGILAPETNPQIFISTPNDDEHGTGDILYRPQVNKIVNLLTNEKGPFQGVTVTTRGYWKPTRVSEEDDGTAALAAKARGKILIQYDNDQWLDDLGPEDPNEPGQNPQKAIYRVYLEDQMYEHTWKATDAQKLKPNSCSAKQKRDNGGSCSKPPGTASGINPSGSASASGKIIPVSSSTFVVTSETTSAASKTSAISRPGNSTFTTKAPSASSATPWCLHGASPHGTRLPSEYCMCGPQDVIYYSVATGSDPCPYTGTPGPTVTWTTPAATTPSPKSTPPTTVPSQPTIPPKAYKTGICSMHIHESATGGSPADSLSADVEVKDDGGNTIGMANNPQFSWGTTIIIHKEDTKLDDDIIVIFPKTTPRFGKRMCCGGFTAPPDFSYEKRLIEVQIGRLTWDSSVTDQSKTPHFNVGGWDRNGAPPVSH